MDHNSVFRSKSPVWWTERRPLRSTANILTNAVIIWANTSMTMTPLWTPNEEPNQVLFWLHVRGRLISQERAQSKERKVDRVIGVGECVCVGGWVHVWLPTHTCTPSAHPFHLYPLLLCFNVMTLYYAAHQHAESKAVHPEQSESTTAPDSVLRSNSGTLN